MVAKKVSKGGGDAGGEGPLQAILLADSFATMFHPITLERPKVLLPLVNAPMIEYTLSWLESAGVKEVFVFCSAHANQVVDYLENSNWLNQPNFSVSTIKSCKAMGTGDALRSIYDMDVIHGDFVLVTGDTVTDMSLTEVLKQHKERKKRDEVLKQHNERKKRDSIAVMTMVIKQSKPSSPATNQELFMAIDPETKELLYYDTSKSDTTRTPLLNDKQDCYIDICSPVVLELFKDYFDYQDLRRLVQVLLDDELERYKIFTHEIHSSYAERVESYRSYDTISKDIIQRWPSYPVIGSGTTIGKHSEVSNSVIGEDCVIGSNVSIDGCYIWNKVKIEDGCRLKHAIVCDGVTMKSGVVLEAGTVLSFNVVIGQDFVVPAYLKVSLLQQPVIQDSDSDEELEYLYAGYSSGNVEITSVSDLQMQAASEVGGAGFIWSVGEEERRHSMAPISADQLVEMITSATDELDISNAESTSEEVGLDSGDESDFNGDISNYARFEKEVEAFFLKTIHEDIEEERIISVVTTLRLLYELDSTHSASALFYAMMKYAVDTPHDNSAYELFQITDGVIELWGKLLKYFLPSIDEEIEVLLKFEEMCVESTTEYEYLFPKILHLLYDKGILQEDAILCWASEKEHADESDRVFVKKVEEFLQRLKERREKKV
ncbi:translation initiation factor eIF-2B subunit epsilon-like [Salvia hispanica]|uniref:translation initiation factor eIF-2B subunit epsilon-like n=1 Tax=Salvia hispanica TaxID=49212 RepID=UPI0020093D93|nr:translation initiation factor eIF-2B subunit epsilon-like [Salvia hispanica]